jgi:hypothetical protein
MYTVTAIYEGCEIGFGEGEGIAYATDECIESISQIYKDCVDRQLVAIHIRDENGVMYPLTWLDCDLAIN